RAGTGRPEQRDEFAAPDAERHVAYGLGAAAKLERFAQPANVDTLDTGLSIERCHGQFLHVQAGYAFRAASTKLVLTRSAGVSGLMPVISRNQTFSPRAHAAASMVAS